ncbi:MAG: ATP-dependent RecD-like DNA helicase [Deltaproteobacteria bacterium]|nr:ATP-dependent RecD-like DNA helicase [Deltaproteobacteria bacterium]MBW1958450.1 ATP-dependent RecD-like DNA helicase [Deltaproteobacteria bacterium]MBW2013902.1 ATP-dependent RecD-like DNA helicase [Deltaproteobacteria bacterium]MBW2087710.1 ATP-dependent RecD-like DNA helicase [Deltaproteobacteria bacterium]MBW2320084.1 ATP-dependent RecD-like DNA helicase [Deltaproteobacteria bacterium]
MNTLEGCLERITYFNAENHYTIAKLKTSKTHNIVTIVGTMAAANPGQTLKIKGIWETHPRYGQQFKISSYEVVLPATIDGIRKYLESGIIKGIGPSMANRIVSCFGTKTFEIIEKEPEKLLEVKAIGKAKAALICNAWKDHHVARSLMQFLQNMGVQTSYCAKILKEYGPDAVNIISKDPFRLTADIPGIGFYFADTVAQKQGIEKDHPRRVRACILHVMQQFTNQGDVFAYQDQIVDHCKNLFRITPGVALDEIDRLFTAGELVFESAPGDPKKIIYLKDIHQAETGIANRLNALLSVPITASGINEERILREVQKKLAITLSSEQLNALEAILSHRAVIITGGPGTGKTTLIKSITAVFSVLGKHVFLAAPTGRAARRLSEVTRSKATTIHKMLGFNFKAGFFEKNPDNPLDADAIIIDEASMVDTFLMYHLIKALPMTSVLIMVGDIFQLPSVGPGNVLSDMIKSKRLPVFYLKKIFRQTHESPIVVNAHRVRRGESPVLKSLDNSDDVSEFYFLEQNNQNRVVSTIVELCTKTIPERFDFDPMYDVQVLTPMHKGVIGTTNLNQVLQKVLNPKPVMIEAMGSTFKTGDKIMHLKNNYQKEVFNGDIGIISAINRKEKQLSVDYYGRIVTYDFTEMDEISLAYAISVHKSQGSEYPAVILPIMTQHFVLLQRNLLYTGITRGENLVILVGTKNALNIALRNNKPTERLSGLASRLMDN